MTTHLMLDLETLGTRPGAVVLSAAIVRFSDEAACSVNLSIPEQTALGMHQNELTLDFWNRQSSTAWAAATANPLPIASALPYLAQWIKWAAPNDDALIWCHGATFDCPLLGELYRVAGIDAPWEYNAVRCTRTLYDLAGVNLYDYTVQPQHIAVNDAISQVRAANAALGILARAHHQVAA